MSVRGEGTGGTRPGGPERPFGAVLASAVEGFRKLARKHVELARIEAGEATAIRGRGVAMFAAAAVVAVYAVGFIAAAAAAALALVLPVWAAILFVGAVLIAVAAIAALLGRRTLRDAPPAGRLTRTTLEEDARWAKQQIAR